MKTHLRPRRLVAFGLAAACALSLVQSVSAQWMTQRIPLVQGWNAIHLKVDPVDASCESVFSPDAYPTAVTMVSWWNRDRLDDGTGSTITDFRNWYRSGGEPSTFSRVIGDQRYLVYSDRAFNLDIFGTPAIPSGTIYLGEYNLVGLNVPNFNKEEDQKQYAPTYYEYFMPFYYRSPSWYGVTTENGTLRIANSAQVTNTSRAVWLETTGSGMTTFSGPFLVSLGNSAKTLAWTDNASLVRTLTVKNISSEDRVLQIYRASSDPPPTGQGTMAGNVALLRETTDWSGGFANTLYVPFLNDETSTFSTNLAAGATFELRLKPDLAEMPGTDGDYMSILKVSDKGSTISGEVRAEGTCLYRVGAFASGSLEARDLSARAGLWVGTVVLGQVNRAKTLSSAEPPWVSTNLVTAPHPFQFRVLVHVDAAGNAKLLKQAFTAMKNAESDTYLLADRETAVAFRGAYPGGTITRTASANFPFMEPLALIGGAFAVAGVKLSATFTQAYDDKTNPFVHAFHPQHDNLEFNNQKPSKLGDGDEGRGEYESWGVTREISFTFAAEDPVGGANVEWNRTVVGGLYEETVSGLTGQGKPILTRGAFRLTKVNDARRIYSGGSLD